VANNDDSDKTSLRSTAGDGETWSYHISALYAPVGWVSWVNLASEYLQAQALVAKNSYEAMQGYTNTRLALPYSSGTSETTGDALQKRSEAYKLRTVPRGGLVLTCAVDVQGDRLEAMVVANGRDGERWVVDYQVITGTPTDKATWDLLDEYLQKPLAHIDGAALTISAALIDTGYSTHDVYGYIRGKKRRKILAIKGANRPNKPIISSRPSLVDVRTNGKTDPKGCELWTIGTDTAKQYLWERWALRTGAGAMHFSNDLPIEFFDGLVSENRVIKYSKGARVVTWEKPNGARNEPLDLSVYNLAAAYYLGLHKKTEADWEELEATILPKSESVVESVKSENEPNVWDLIK
jgi:phage terminase large subunit GpA-like protein